MADFAIYTALVGNYDEIMQPVVVDERFDYVLFSNDVKSENVGVWSVRRIPDVIKNDNKRLSRYPKSHPETMLADYKASLYIDANIQIQDQWVYERFLELYNKQIEYAGVKLVLTGRDCIYDHAFDMCRWLVVHDYEAIKQCHKLYKLGFPHHFGLNENNIIFRKHTERMKETDEEWWDWILNNTCRDQLSYMYCIWKHKIPLNYFLPEGEDARNGSHFHLVNHDGQLVVIKTKIIKRGLFEKIRIKCMSYDTKNSLERWTRIYKSSLPVAYLYFDGIINIIRNIPHLLKLI